MSPCLSPAFSILCPLSNVLSIVIKPFKDINIDFFIITSNSKYSVLINLMGNKILATLFIYLFIHCGGARI